MPTNIELKVPLHELNAARRVAQRLATAHLGTEEQLDTYYRCAHGRLKLRQRAGQRAQLIWYDRPDERGARRSDYQLLPIDEPAAVDAMLTAALGVKVRVEKRREIFLVDNVRIHLDEITPLGTFLEFESVLSAEIDAPTGHAQLARLAKSFGVDLQRGVASSYADLLPADSPEQSA